tara:strand:- start:175 stop:351 length:177 start_codon:yes stop_codon:yes gene_type:complete
MKKTVPAGKSRAKAAVMQPKYRAQVVESRKAYRRKSAKAETTKTLRSEGFAFLGSGFL